VWERTSIGRIGLECFFTGHQALTGADTDNPYRATSPSFAIFGLLLQRQLGPVSVILNGENLADRRLTRVHPLLLPARAADGRWTVDAWGPARWACNQSRSSLACGRALSDNCGYMRIEDCTLSPSNVDKVDEESPRRSCARI